MLRINRTRGALAVLLAIGAGASSASAAIITLTATNGGGTTSFATSLSWSNAAAPTAGNDYSVSGGFTIRNVADSTGTVTFAGDHLLLGNTTTAGIMTYKNLGTAAIVNANYVLDNGEFQAGGSASGAVNTTTIGGTVVINSGGGRLNTGTTGRGLIVSVPITGTGLLSVLNGGFATLNGDNSAFSGGITLNGAAATLLNLGTATALGTGTFTVNSGNLGSIDNTSGGAMTLSTNNAMTWSNNFGFVGTNDLNLGTGAISMPGGRTITLGGGKTLTVGGDITGAANSLTALGTGILVLNGNNAYSGGTTIGAANSATGVRATSSNALGTGAIGILGNGGGGRLELTNNITLASAITLSGKTAVSNGPGIESLSGNNTLSNTISPTTGGNFYTIQSDAGLLTLNNATAVNGNTLTATRTLTLQGAGNGLISGAISPGTGGLILNVTKAGAGTWTLSSTSNTYTGVTEVDAGILALGASNVLPDASAVTMAGGTLSSGGFSDVAATLALTANSSLDLGSGASILSFANSSAVSWTAATTLSINNWTGLFAGGGTDQVFVGTTATGLTAGQLAQINFTGFQPGAVQLATGEIVPVPEPTTLGLLGMASLTLVARRRKAR